MENMHTDVSLGVDASGWGGLLVVSCSSIQCV